MTFWYLFPTFYPNAGCLTMALDSRFDSHTTKPTVQLLTVLWDKRIFLCCRYNGCSLNEKNIHCNYLLSARV